MFLRYRWPGFETTHHIIKQIAHNWPSSCCQCTDTCSHISSIENDIYKPVPHESSVVNHSHPFRTYTLFYAWCLCTSSKFNSGIIVHLEILPEHLWNVMEHVTMQVVHKLEYNSSTAVILPQQQAAVAKPFSQWQCSFHLKAALPLAERLATVSDRCIQTLPRCWIRNGTKIGPMTVLPWNSILPQWIVSLPRYTQTATQPASFTCRPLAWLATGGSLIIFVAGQ